MKRALIVKLGAIGDVVMAVPAVHLLHAQGFQIDWVAASQAASVLRLYPFVRVVEAEEQAILHGSPWQRLVGLQRVWRQLARHYDLVATLYYDRRYRLLSLPVLASRYIRLRTDNRRWNLLPGRHHTDEFARILLDAAAGESTTANGADVGDTGPVPTSVPPLRPVVLPACPLPPAGRPRITLAPGGARNLLRDDRLRRWPLELYAALAKLLDRAGYDIVLTGGPGDTWVREAFAGMPHTDLIGQLSLPEVIALFDASAVVVTHDSGPLHLAGLTRCGLLGIFGPVDPRARLPRRPGAVALWGGEGYACRPCYDGSRYARCRDNTCMAEVTPEHALQSVENLLRNY